MADRIGVKVSSRYQVVVSSAARERLNLRSGDRLLVDIQDGVLVLLPQPQNYAAHLAGLHSDFWAGVDAVTYVQEERQAWKPSTEG
jgi:AbrB family looped-hinge helix DNA binding protein